MLLFASIPIFPEYISKITGIEVVSNFVFASILFLIILILFSVTIIISKMKHRITKLAQANALLEQRIRNIEKIIIIQDVV